MLVAVGVAASAAFLFAYRYLASRPVPKLAVSDSFDNVAAPVEKPNDADETPISTDSTPRQTPKGDKDLMPPPPLPAVRLDEDAPKQSLMPPPPQPKPSIPKTSPSLRPPPSAASTLRAPPTHTPRPNSAFAPSTSTLPPAARPSRKVLLAPGHSPLDWAQLTQQPPSPTFLRGSDVPPGRLLRVTPKMLKAHNGRKGSNAWGVFGGKVYNMGPYLDFHPGGVPEIMKAAGNTHGDRLFREVHPWVSWDNMLGECCVGILVSDKENEDGVRDKQEMDEMD